MANITKSPKRFTFKKRVYGKVGILEGSTLYRSINTLYVLSGRGKDRKPVSVARFI